MGTPVNEQRQLNSATPKLGFGGVSTQQQIQANQQQKAADPFAQLQGKSIIESTPAGTNSTMNAPQGAPAPNCCFIMLEGHNGVLPWYVRACRDHFYALEPEVATGYKSMAKWLVPLMRKSACIKHLVNAVMVKPLTRYGAYLCKEARYSLHGHVAKLAWFAIWRLTAR